MAKEDYKKNDKYLRAQKRVNAMKGFHWHLFASLFAVLFLAVINYITTSYPWCLFPISAILLSIAIHWFVVFKSGSIFGKSWEERKIQEFLDEENNNKKLYQ